MLGAKDPNATLNDDDLRELLDENREFDRWLKRDKKLCSYANARDDREERRKKLEELLKKAGDPCTLRRIADEIGASREEQSSILLDIKEFFENYLGIETCPSPKESVQPSSETKVIGRVAPTIHTPATATEFSFWVKDDENIHVEIGSLVTARNQGVSVTGLVSETQAISDVEGVLDSFYGHALGRPEEEMPTKLPLVVSAKVEVVRRSDGRTEPVRGAWPVTFAKASEIREAYGAEISPDHEVLAGFAYDDQGNPVPIGIDARYVIGYEAAHVNIAGASGVATKTSYALFLLYALLAYAEQHKDPVAAVAFNVKEADLMFIDQLPEDWGPLVRWRDHGQFGRSIRLWEQAKDNYGIDPIAWSKNGNFRFFAPTRERGGVLSQRQSQVTEFNYSLQTLIQSSVGALYALFDPEDIDEKAQALIASMTELAVKEGFTFEKLLDAVGKAPRSGDWVSLDGSRHHYATVNKILNRMRHSVQHQLRGVVNRTENTGCPIPIDKLKSGDLLVIDITQLNDKGQRLVFQTVVRKVFQKLEERKILELTGQLQEESELASFPKHVVIFVDELNKFVPIGREHSPLKGEVVETAARGRSVGMSLLGAQQLASKVDEEVLANTSTFAIGRSHPVEIRKPPYAWLAEGLKERALVLDKGWMLLWHCLHKRPVLIHFPIPLHRIFEEMKEHNGRA